MNILDYNYPNVQKVNLVFSTFDTPDVLLKEAKERGFYNAETPANNFFNQWFFSGIKEFPRFKENIDEEKSGKAMLWARAYMGSFAPKHEDKEAVCAMIFNECLILPDKYE